MGELRFSSLRADEFAEATAALRQAALPTDDIDGERMRFFRLADDLGTLGWAALEQYGSDALLRSVLTVPGRQGSGAGTELLRRVTSSASRTVWSGSGCSPKPPRHSSPGWDS